MEEWGMLVKVLISDLRVEGEEKRKSRNSRTKPIKLWTFFFLVNMKRESLLILRSRRRRRVLKTSSERNFNVYRDDIAITCSCGKKSKRFKINTAFGLSPEINKDSLGWKKKRSKKTHDMKKGLFDAIRHWGREFTKLN